MNLDLKDLVKVVRKLSDWEGVSASREGRHQDKLSDLAYME